MAHIQELYKTYGIEAAIKYDDDFRRLKGHLQIDISKSRAILDGCCEIRTAKRYIRSKPYIRSQNPRTNTMQCPIVYCKFLATRGCYVKRFLFGHSKFTEFKILNLNQFEIYKGEKGKKNFNFR